MTPDEYQADCLLTESLPDPETFLDSEVKQRMLALILHDSLDIGWRADRFKKHLFYGREVAFTFDIHDKHKGVTLDKVEDKSQMVRLLHAVLGLQSEVAEIAEQLLASLLEGKPLDPTSMMEEGGDALWYNSVLLDACGFKMSDTMRRNIAKLAKRYPNQIFTSQAALNRDLDAERAELEE